MAAKVTAKWDPEVGNITADAGWEILGGGGRGHLFIYLFIYLCIHSFIHSFILDSLSPFARSLGKTCSPTSSMYLSHSLARCPLYSPAVSFFFPVVADSLRCQLMICTGLHLVWGLCGSRGHFSRPFLSKKTHTKKQTNLGRNSGSPSKQPPTTPFDPSSLRGTCIFVFFQILKYRSEVVGLV